MLELLPTQRIACHSIKAVGTLCVDAQHSNYTLVSYSHLQPSPTYYNTSPTNLLDITLNSPLKMTEKIESPAVQVSDLTDFVENDERALTSTAASVEEKADLRLA